MPTLPSSRALVAWIPKVTSTAFTFAIVGFGIVALSAVGTARAQVCALPGSAGDATISGTVNTYWTAAPGSYDAGAAAIPLSGERGAAATLAAGDLVLAAPPCVSPSGLTVTGKAGHRGPLAVGGWHGQ